MQTDDFRFLRHISRQGSRNWSKIQLYNMYYITWVVHIFLLTLTWRNRPYIPTNVFSFPWISFFEHYIPFRFQIKLWIDLKPKTFILRTFWKLIFPPILILSKSDLPSRLVSFTQNLLVDGGPFSQFFQKIFRCWLVDKFFSKLKIPNILFIT